MLLRLSPGGEVLSRHARAMEAWPKKPAISATKNGPLIAWIAGNAPPEDRNVMLRQATAEGELSGKTQEVELLGEKRVTSLPPELFLFSLDPYRLLLGDSFLTSSARAQGEGAPGALTAPLLPEQGYAPVFLPAPAPRLAWWQVEHDKLLLVLAPFTCVP